MEPSILADGVMVDTVVGGITTGLLIGGVSLLVILEILLKVAKIYIVEKHLPLLGLILGTGLGYVTTLVTSTDLMTGLVGGFVMGAVTLGLYDFRKETLGMRV